MVKSMLNRRLSGLSLAIAIMLIPALLMAAESRTSKASKAAVNQESVEMFSAIEKGQINVKLIPKDSTHCRVMIENKTDKPLNVKLPETFAGVPVLAQAAGAADLPAVPAAAVMAETMAAAIKAWAAAWAAWAGRHGRHGRRIFQPRSRTSR